MPTKPVPPKTTNAGGSVRPEGGIPSDYYFHGGGYVMGSLDTHRGLCARLSRAARARVLSVDYRLAPEHPHPAAVEDALAAVRFARGAGLAPGRAAIAGDSAGGGLTLATLVALREAGDPPPAAGLCVSPWTDLAFTGSSIATKADVDPMLRAADLALMADAYLAGADPRTPLASPLYADYAGLPPLLLQVGSAAHLAAERGGRRSSRRRGSRIPVIDRILLARRS